MSGSPSRRHVLIGGALGVGTVTGTTSVFGSAAAAAAPAAAAHPKVRRPHVRPRPVAPVNQAIADQMPLSYKVMPEQAVGVDVEKEIGIHTLADIETKRADLIDYVWKGSGLPTRRPDADPGVPIPPELAGLTGVRQTTRLTIPLKYGVTATQYLFLPRGRSNERLAIYHTGHGEAPAIRVRTVQGLLDLGYAVLCSDMPFNGWNVQLLQSPDDPSTYSDPGTGTRPHNMFGAYETSSFSAMTFFLEPLTVGINYVERLLNPRSIALVGLSGGGWTATAYAAIDTRITRSYPTAGTFPFYLRPGPPRDSTGDWEQGGVNGATVPGFYAIASFGDLYVMGAVGPRRGQLQILNRFDACCFAGVGPRSYAPVVSHRVALLGEGMWDQLEDATHNLHQVSPYALEVILWDLESNPPD